MICGKVHVWHWREEACISVYTLGRWKIRAQVFLSESNLENGTEDVEPRLDI